MLDAERRFSAPEGLLQIPREERGVASYEVAIPAGLQLSLVDLATPEAVPLASARLEERPSRGATGRLRLRVAWSHPVPLGVVAFRLRVYASPDGTPPAVTAPITEPGAEHRLRVLVEQDSPVDLAVTGPLVQAFHDQILARGGRIEPLATQSELAAGTVAAIVAVSLAVIAATCIVIGMATFAAVLFFAISRGYDVEDAGYKVVVGQGDSRQEHQMVFNLRQPNPGQGG